MFTGRCLCGAVTYEIDAEPQVVAHCHCTDCQRISGTGHTTGAMFPADKVVIAGPVAAWTLTAESGNTVTRTFCPRCGSPLHGQNSGMPGWLMIAVGTLDDSDRVTPQVAVFAARRRHWDLVDPSLPTYATQPAWRPESGV